MNKQTPMKGYKVFNHDWTCRGFQYTCPGTFEEDVTPSVCDRGFHFCLKAADCFNYYIFDPKNKVAEVIAIGEVSSTGDKCCTNKIQIVREVPWSELLEIVNTGKGCSGLCNSGNWNSGDRNSGDRNSGDWNSGNWNSGDWNSGNWNSGNWNSGNWNSGNWNSGNWNSGNWNSGDRNSGDWNKTSFSNGCFNTVEPTIFLFNKPSGWTFRKWQASDACRVLSSMPISGSMLEYVYFANMTGEEKSAHPEAATTGGYLNVLKENESRQVWWDGLIDGDKKTVVSIPNFDPAIFEEITGIRVTVLPEGGCE